MRGAVGIAGIIVAAMASSLLVMPQGYAASGEEVIEGRQKFMREEIGSHWKRLAAFAKSGGEGSLADIEKSAQAISGLAKKIPGHFPKDTGRGAYPDTMTRALPAVWTEQQKFQGYVQKLEEESAKLAAVAKAGDKAGALAMIGETGSFNKTKIGCADCHSAFQGPSVKK
jgi:cytochrome c556